MSCVGLPAALSPTMGDDHGQLGEQLCNKTPDDRPAHLHVIAGDRLNNNGPPREAKIAKNGMEKATSKSIR